MFSCGHTRELNRSVQRYVLFTVKISVTSIHFLCLEIELGTSK
jgi:hypothetical protein